MRTKIQLCRARLDSLVNFERIKTLEMKRQLFIFSLILFLISNLNMKVQSQTTDCLLYKYGGNYGVSSYLADGIIEMNNEDYSRSCTVPISWYIIGGTITSGEYNSNMVKVKWDQNATQHSLTSYETSNTANQSTIIVKKDVSFTFSPSTPPIYCSNNSVNISTLVKINTTASVYYALGTTIKWYLRNASTNIALGQCAGTGNSVNGSLSFIPDAVGISNGSYNIVAECWRQPDELPLATSDAYAIEIHPSAPSLITNDIVFKEEVNSPTKKNTTLSINGFTYAGTHYTPSTWPTGSSFTVTAVTNNRQDITYPYDPGLNFLSQASFSNWNGLCNIKSQNGFQNLDTNFTILEMTFSKTDGNSCAWQGNFIIPKPTFVSVKPNCPGSFGSIAINNVDAPAIFKLYQCEFDVNGDINNYRNINYRYPTQMINNNAIFSSLPSGEYFVRIEKPPFIIEEYIDLRAYPIQINSLSTDKPNCYQGIDGSITISGLTYNNKGYSSSELSGFNFLLDGVNCINNSNIILGSSTQPIPAGNHYIKFSIDGCTSDSMSINIPARLQNKFSYHDPVRPTCFNKNNGTITIDTINIDGAPYSSNIDYNIPGENITFHSIGADTLSFDALDDFPLPYEQINTLSGGKWNIYYTKGDGCISDTIEIIVPDGPGYSLNYTTDIVVDSADCPGLKGSVSLNGFTYDKVPADKSKFNYYVSEFSKLSGGETFTSPIAIIPVTNGKPSYLYIKENESSCFSAPFELNVGAPDTITISELNPIAQCSYSDSILLAPKVEHGSGGYSYIWTDVNENKIGTNELIKAWQGFYKLHVQDKKGCPKTRSFFVSRPEILNLSAKQTDIDSIGKANGSISLVSSGGGFGHTYSKDGANFQNQPFFGGLTEGTYTFWVKEDAGCLTSINVAIGTAPIFSTSLKSVNHIKCNSGKDGQIAISANGGVKPYRFKITGPSGTIEQEDSVFKGLGAGTYSIHVYYNTYEYSIPDITLIEPTLALQASIIDHTDAVCNESVGMATVTATGGTSPYNYLWDDPATQTNPKAENLVGAIYKVIVHDANNCMASASIQLFDPMGPVLTQIGADSALCSNSLGGGGAMLSVSGGVGPFDVFWPGINLHDSVANNIAPGNYTATVTDATNCSSSFSGIYVPSPDELKISFDDFEDPTCFNGTNGKITASGIGGTPKYQFSWQNIANAGNTNVISELVAGNYTLKLTDAHNCETTKSFELRNPDPISIDLPDSVFICEGQTATFDAGNPGMDHHWVLSDGSTADQQIIYAQTQGNYSITVTNTLGCSNSKTLHLKHENRVLDAAFIISSQATMSDTIIAIEISWPMPDSLQWFIPGDFEVIKDLNYYKELIPLQAGEYTIGMKAFMSGCSDVVEKKITIFPSENSNKSGIEKPEDLIKSAKLFPNPTSGNFQIEIELSHVADIQADVFNMRGLKIIPTKLAYGEKQYLIDFNLLRLDPGVYFVNIVAEKEVKKLKFIVE